MGVLHLKLLGWSALLLSFVLTLLTYYAQYKFFVEYYFSQAMLDRVSIYIPEERDGPPDLLTAGKVLNAVPLFLTVMALWALARVSFSDPGYVLNTVPCVTQLARADGASNSATPLPNGVRQRLISSGTKSCKRCRLDWKPPRAYHCKVCARCVMLMDHHCYFVNNCVGAKNQKYFIQFLVYAGALSALASVYLTIAGSLYAIELQIEDRLYEFKQITFEKGAFLTMVMVDVFFTFFIYRFLKDQINNVCYNQTLVEYNKETRGRRQRVERTLTRIFGKNKVLWWLPIAQALQVSYVEGVYECKKDDVCGRFGDENCAREECKRHAPDADEKLETLDFYLMK